MTEFETKVLEWLEQTNHRFDRVDQRFDRLEQRIARIEKSTVVLGELLPKVAVMVDELHTDYLVRSGFVAREE